MFIKFKHTKNKTLNFERKENVNKNRLSICKLINKTKLSKFMCVYFLPVYQVGRYESIRLFLKVSRASLTVSLQLLGFLLVSHMVKDLDHICSLPLWLQLLLGVIYGNILLALQSTKGSSPYFPKQ